MRVKMFGTSSIVLVALATISSNTAAFQADRYSGFECEGYVWPPEQYTWYGQTYTCPVLNWFPDGLADVSRVFVNLTMAYPASWYDCSPPSAKACVIYAARNSNTYGSACSLEATSLTRQDAGANAIQILSTHLTAWHSNYPLGAGYLFITVGGADGDICTATPAVLRGYTVESD
ncbi:hypothetical protein WME73_39310 [Sorangium sp. So ce302]|uniref:hypothetical protein n=1 Tax=unclassified Sorangium TaxID=2621164 RepID=UPI003F5F7CA2